MAAPVVLQGVRGPLVNVEAPPVAKDGAEDKWYELYQDNELPWEAYEDDPIHKLEEEAV